MGYRKPARHDGAGGRLSCHVVEATWVCSLRWSWGSSEAGAPFKDALKGAKGPRPLHHHITGCHVEGCPWDRQLLVAEVMPVRDRAVSFGHIPEDGGSALQGSECRAHLYLPESSTMPFCLGCSAPTFLPHRIPRTLETI